MTKEQLLEELRKIGARKTARRSDPERDHVEADELLLKYINDDEVIRLYNTIDMWYA